MQQHLPGPTSICVVIQPITTLPRIAFRPGGYGEFHNRAPMPIDLRIFLFSRGLLLTLPETNRQIVYHRVGDLDEVNIIFAVPGNEVISGPHQQAYTRELSFHVVITCSLAIPHNHQRSVNL